MAGFSGYLPELYMGLSSLLVHKLRSLLTMLGMIFGVGAVVAMLVHHRRRAEGDDELHRLSWASTTSSSKPRRRWTATNCRRGARSRPGLTFRDFRAISENVPGLVAHHAAQALQAAEGAAQDQRRSRRS